MEGAQGTMHCPVRKPYSILTSEIEQKESLSVKLLHVKLQHTAAITHTSDLRPTGTETPNLAERLHHTPTSTDIGNWQPDASTTLTA